MHFLRVRCRNSGIGVIFGAPTLLTPSGMKTRTNALLLAFFLGGMGAHKFYLNKNGQGLAYLLFCWTFIPSLIAIGDIFWLAFLSDAEFHRRFNSHLLAPVGGYALYQQAPGYGHPQAAWQQQQGYPPPQPFAPHAPPQPPSQYPPPGYVQPHAPAPAPPPQPAPGSEYQARLAYLEQLRQNGSIDQAAYEAAKEELRRAN